VSVVVGMSEAVVVALVVKAAAALAAQQGSIDLALGAFRIGNLAVRKVLFIALIGVLFRTAFQLIVLYVPVRMGTGAASRLRHRVLGAYLGARWDCQVRIRQGGFVDLLTNQTEMASEFVTAFASAIGAALTFLTLTGAAAAISPVAFVGLVVIACVLFLLLRPITRTGQRRAKSYSQASERLATHADTVVAMAEEIRTFGVAGAIQAQAADFVDGVREQRVGMDVTGRSVWATYQNTTMVLMVTVLLVLTTMPRLHLASLGAVVLILMRSLSGGQDLQGHYNLARQRLPFVQKIASVLGDLEGGHYVSGGEDFGRLDRIELKNVGFAYVPSKPVLLGVSVSIKPGELVAIVGPSGAGKSTLLQILLQLRTPDSGEYLLGERPVAMVSTEEWTRHVAYVPQETRVIHGTVADNIRFFRDIPLEDVMAAARAAQIDKDITALPEGYETIIGQRFQALSGGQRQRLCLARALAGHPHLLILDEPTSALDNLSEVLVHEALARLRGQVTTIVVAHRPNVLRVCDRVITLDGGVVRRISEEVGELSHEA
jgi:ATP-binding cassette, subfamily B, bacterial